MNFRTILFLSVIAIGAASCGQNYVEGHGAISSEARNINKTFNSIEIEAPVDATITIQPGSTPSFSLSGYSNLMKYVRTEVHDSTLRIYIPDITDMHTNKKLKATISMTSLTDLSISGASDVAVLGNIIVPEFSVDISGASEVTLQSVEASKLSVDASGAGSFTVQSGRVSTALYDFSGAATIKTYGLECRKVRLDLSGAGDAQVWATEKLSADVSGAGSVTYKGDPAVRSDVSGIGSVERQDGGKTAASRQVTNKDDDSTEDNW